MPPQVALIMRVLSPHAAGRWADALRPQQGESSEDHDATWHAYGSKKMGRIGYLADGVLNVFSDEKGPYDDSRSQTRTGSPTSEMDSRVTRRSSVATS